MQFIELSKLAKCYAITFYNDNWVDSHGLDDIDYYDIYDILIADQETLYDKYGSMINENNE
jgi:hypothetical protein